MTAPIKVLHLEDVPIDSELVAAQLRQAGMTFELLHTETRHEFEDALARFPVDVVVSDFTLPSFDGLTALSITRTLRPDTPFIFFSGTIGEERAVAALKSGADDYVLKEHPARLPAAIVNALQQREEQRRRREAEAKVREHAAILNRVGDAVFVTDLQRRIVFWNRSAERLFGTPAEQALGRDAAEALTLAGAILPTIEEVMAAGEWQTDMSFRPRGGSDVVVESRWSLLRDVDGHPRSVFVANVDVTERRQLEQRLLRAQRLESIGALAGGIAHDLNNLLSPIVLSTGVLEQELRNPELQPMLRTIASSARRGAELVRQILSFARGTAPGRRPIDFGQFMHDTTGFITSVLPRTIHVAVSVAPETPPVVADTTQIFQVLMNFAINARDAMPRGGRIDISVSEVTLPRRRKERLTRQASGRFVAIGVRDSGDGIPADVMDHIFEPFFTTKGDERGTGLGLSTCSQIAENHGGLIGVTSQPGVGSDFVLYLPVAQDAAAGAPTRATEPSQPLILAVDDDLAVLELIRLMLESNGYAVLSATSGVEALGLLKQNFERVQLVIADFNMANMDGASLMRALHRHKPGLPCIGMTGEISAGDEAGWSGEIVERLEKPFSTAQLFAVVSRFIPPPQPMKSSLRARAEALGR